MMDLVNGLFELGMAVTIWASVHRLVQDKVVRGFHWSYVAFPTGWGVWNLVYYPSLEQWLSFAGGVAVVTANLTYLSFIWAYSRRG